MSLPISTRQRIAFQPVADGGTFHLRVPTIFDAEDFEVELRAAGFRYLTNGQMCDLMIAELSLNGGGFTETVELIEAVKAWNIENAAADEADRTKLDPETARLFGEIEQVLLRNSEPYRRAVAERGASLNRLFIVAFRLFVTGWDGVVGKDGAALPYARDLDGRVSDEALMALDRDTMLAVGAKAHSLLRPGADTRKNSPSLSRSPKSPAASPETAPPTVAPAGKSTENSSRKTRPKT